MKNRPLGFQLAVLASVATASVATEVAAQDAMAQGEAMINVRSDVKLGIKGTRGTPSAHLQELTDVVAAEMPDFRRCYAKVVAKHPATVGALAVRVTLDKQAKPKLEFKEKGGDPSELTPCVRKVLRRAPLRKVTAPAAAIITLDFENTRAEGQREMQAAQTVASAIDVHEEGGQLVGTFQSDDGKVGFRVRAKQGEKGQQAVQAVTSTLRDRYPLFADCRRRSQKDGLSPEGVMDIALRLQMRGQSSAKIRSSTVAHKRAVPCVERAMRRLKFEGAPPGQKVDLEVTFGG